MRTDGQTYNYKTPIRQGTTTSTIGDLANESNLDSNNLIAAIEVIIDNGVEGTTPTGNFIWNKDACYGTLHASLDQKRYQNLNNLYGVTSGGPSAI